MVLLREIKQATHAILGVRSNEKKDDDMRPDRMSKKFKKVSKLSQL